MPLYTVLAPPPSPEAAAPDPVNYLFVKDGFCWPFLLVSVIWMLYRRLWLGLIFYVLVMVAAALAAQSLGGGPIGGVMFAFVHVFFALQGNAIRRWTLERHGYALVGVAEGRRVADAEVRFFHELRSAGRDPRQPPPSRMAAVLGPSTARAPSAESGEVVGLFPSPKGTP
jgi:hypothetical protein